MQILKLMCSVAVFGSVLNSQPAKADCDFVDFAITDFKHIVSDETTAIAFLKVATREQIKKAAESAGGSIGSIPITGDYKKDQEAVDREAEMINFKHNSRYYLNYLTQQFSEQAANAYRSCLELDKQSAGLRVWLKKREGDYFTLYAYWVGGDETQDGPGKYDGDPNTRDLEVVMKPDYWPRAKTQEIVILRDPKRDGFLGLSIGHQTAHFVAMRDPEVVQVRSHMIVSAKTMNAHTSCYNGNVMEPGRDSDCITPTRPDGRLVLGSGKETNFTARQFPNANVKVSSESPERICFDLIVTTGDCMVDNLASAQATAIERYPEVTDSAKASAARRE